MYILFCDLWCFVYVDVYCMVLLCVLFVGYVVVMMCEIVEMLFVDGDVCVIDWCNVCDVLFVVGCFGFDEYVVMFDGFVSIF